MSVFIHVINMQTIGVTLMAIGFVLLLFEPWFLPRVFDLQLKVAKAKISAEEDREMLPKEEWKYEPPRKLDYRAM